MKEQLGTERVDVYADHVCVGLHKYRIPFRARMFILNFDSGLPVDPLGFLMEAIPELSPPVPAESPELRELEALRRQIFEKEAVPKPSPSENAPPKQLPKGAGRRWWSGVVGWRSK